MGSIDTTIRSASRPVEVDNLSVRFDGRTVLDGFSLSLDAGEKVALTGRSGGGKSTLLKCLMGFVPKFQGGIRIFGEPLGPATVWRLRRALAWVPQEPDLGGGTAREALARPFAWRANRAQAAAMDRAPALMERLLLDHALLDKPVSTLSGGEKQRIAVVGALLLDRPLLLLDEPASALDPESRLALAALLGEQENRAMLCVTHDADTAPFCTRQIAVTPCGEAVNHG